MTAVKFCGLTRPEDVRVAVRLGVEYLGLNFVPASPRYLPPERVAPLVEAAHREAARLGTAAPAFVGVCAPDGPEVTLPAEVLDLVQWHGPVDASPLDLPLIQALRLPPGTAAPDLPAGPWAYLIDAYHRQLLGGTGRQADWTLAAGLAPRCRLFLAGGLRPENVADAVAAVHPFAVDVAGGIEAAPGVKDHTLMRSFIETVRKADAA